MLTYAKCPDCGVALHRHGLVCKGRCDACGDFYDPNSNITVKDGGQGTRRFCDAVCLGAWQEAAEARRDGTSLNFD